ncbi:hypothetical protein M3Y99_01547700 [Aphelenchoides fujianensis]|nr:hypothetical protein M3Y99_01547700 [Aphelenchoides fujianensis]
MPAEPKAEAAGGKKANGELKIFKTRPPPVVEPEPKEDRLKSPARTASDARTSRTLVMRRKPQQAAVEVHVGGHKNRM